MSRLKLLLIATLITFGLDLLGILFFQYRPLSVTELLLMIFIGAWCGEEICQPTEAKK